MPPAKPFRLRTISANRDFPRPRNLRILAAVSRGARRGADIGAKELSALVSQRFSSVAALQSHRQIRLVGARWRSLSCGRKIFRQSFSLGMDRFARGIQQAVLSLMPFGNSRPSRKPTQCLCHLRFGNPKGIVSSSDFPGWLVPRNPGLCAGIPLGFSFGIPERH